MIYSLIYRSESTSPFTKDQLEELEALSNRNNSGKGITGYLSYKDNTFFQYIEGERREILGLFSKIGLDDRHKIDFEYRFPYRIDRIFEDWSMKVYSPILGRDLNHDDLVRSTMDIIARNSMLGAAFEKHLESNLLHIRRYMSKNSFLY